MKFEGGTISLAWRVKGLAPVACRSLRSMLLQLPPSGSCPFSHVPFPYGLRHFCLLAISAVVLGGELGLACQGFPGPVASHLRICRSENPLNSAFCCLPSGCPGQHLMKGKDQEGQLNNLGWSYFALCLSLTISNLT